MKKGPSHESHARTETFHERVVKEKKSASCLAKWRTKTHMTGETCMGKKRARNIEEVVWRYGEEKRSAIHESQERKGFRQRSGLGGHGFFFCLWPIETEGSFSCAAITAGKKKHVAVGAIPQRGKLFSGGRGDLLTNDHSLRSVGTMHRKEKRGRGTSLRKRNKSPTTIILKKSVAKNEQRIKWKGAQRGVRCPQLHKREETSAEKRNYSP